MNIHIILIVVITPGCMPCNKSDERSDIRGLALTSSVDGVIQYKNIPMGTHKYVCSKLLYACVLQSTQ